jgi:hypothetical protein
MDSQTKIKLGRIYFQIFGILFAFPELKNLEYFGELGSQNSTGHSDGFGDRTVGFPDLEKGRDHFFRGFLTVVSLARIKKPEKLDINSHKI